MAVARIAFSGAMARMISCFDHQDVQGLRRLYDDLLVQTSVDYDERIYQLSLLTYILAKVLSKPRFWRQTRQNAQWREVRRRLDVVLAGERKGRGAAAGAEELRRLFHLIEMAEGRDPRFIKGMMTKARIKAASTFYAQGLSLGQASSMTGLDKREILSYAGQTMMNERLPPIIRVEERMKGLRALFR